MSDTPTFANLLTQWNTGGPAARQSVYAHLRARPNEAAAAEAFFRDDLRSPYPWKRLIAAEAAFEVYRDGAASAAALGWVLTRGEPAAGAHAIAVLAKLPATTAAPLLASTVLHASDAFAALAPAAHRQAGAVLATIPGEWLKAFAHSGPGTESELLMGVADAASSTESDFTPIVPVIKSRLFHERSGYSAGAALWRITWRVNRDWLLSVKPHSPRFENAPALLVLVTEVLTEHLGRRPDFAPVVRQLFARIANDTPEQLSPLAYRLARLGARGWAVLLPLLDDPAVPPAARGHAFNQAAKRPAVARLAQHRSHRVLHERAGDRETVPLHLLDAATGVLTALGPDAAAAVPHLLDLIARQPETAPTLLPAMAACAPGHPHAGAAIARTLDALRRSVVFHPDAFSALAAVYAGINFDGAVTLIDDTSLSVQTLHTLLQEAPWTGAPAAARRRHVCAIADRLGAPRTEVRARAAHLLRGYAAELCEVWPALVAVLIGSDEHTARLALPLFRHLEPVAECVANELLNLFNEPNPVYAARAVIALAHLGRTDDAATARCRAVLTDTTGVWDWTVPPDVSEGAVRAAARWRPFAAPVARIAEGLHDRLFAEETPDEQAISNCVPAAVASEVNWDGVARCVGSDPEGGLMFLALMCGFGSRGFSQKIYLVKHQRTIAGTGLAEAKGVVERVIDVLGRPARPDERRDCVRAYFPPTSAVTPAVLGLLRHRLAWYRWAGLELLDAWGVPDRVPELIGGRTRDRSELVRQRARRMPYC